MHGLTGGDWKRSRHVRKPRQSPTLLLRDLIIDLPAAGGLVGGTPHPSRGHVAALPLVVCAQRGFVAD